MLKAVLPAAMEDGLSAETVAAPPEVVVVVGLVVVVPAVVPDVAVPVGATAMFDHWTTESSS
jgi:hypothetical protein